MLPSQRASFDIPRHICYLNAASWSPLPKATLEAGRAAVERKGTPWTLDASFANQQHERARKAASRLINASPDDVALISSVGYGRLAAPELVRSLRGEAPEPDELGADLPPELVQLGDRPGVGELAEPRRDSRADPAELLRASLPCELEDRRVGRADRLRRPAVGPGRVAGRAREVEQSRERLEPLRDGGVVELCHGASVPLRAISPLRAGGRSLRARGR